MMRSLLASPLALLLLCCVGCGSGGGTTLDDPRPVDSGGGSGVPAPGGSIGGGGSGGGNDDGDDGTGSIEFEQISATAAGVDADFDSYRPALSEDGRLCFFVSLASNLVDEVEGGLTPHIYVKDLVDGSVRLVDQVDGVPAAAGALDWEIATAANGRFVAYRTYADELDPSVDDVPFTADIYLSDLQTGSHELVSRSTAGVPANAISLLTQNALSDDGRYLVFTSRATNLIDTGLQTENAYDVYLRDRQAGTTTLLNAPVLPGSTLEGAFQASISGDGSTILYTSDDPALANFTISIPTQIIRQSRNGGDRLVISRAANGSLANGACSDPVSDRSGRWIAYVSWADNLASEDTNGLHDIFLHDRQNNTTVLVSRSLSGASGSGESFLPRISADGRFVAFLSDAPDLVAEDVDTDLDIFLYDRVADRLSLIGRDADGEPLGAGLLIDLDLGADAQQVVFATQQPGLGVDTDAEFFDVFRAPVDPLGDG